MIINVIIFIVGFVVGALVARNNQEEVNKIVEEAKELAAKAEAELKELKAKTKKPAPKKVKKPIVKKK
tara:strand:+ start:110 stop:313 length:204 start_codon:yes stop_codon:yes gene_type:complete